MIKEQLLNLKKNIQKAQQAHRTGRNRTWVRLAEIYLIQKRRLITFPYPEEFNENTTEDENPPVIKPVMRHTLLEKLYRWGISFRSTGNHRILYTIHNYHKIVLLHEFEKTYNGDIKRADIEPAEEAYQKYLVNDPSLYPVEKG